MMMGHVSDVAFLLVQIPISPGLMGDMAFCTGKKTPYHHIRRIRYLIGNLVIKKSA